MPKPKTKPPPSKATWFHKTTMWTAIASAVDSGWGSTIRLVIVLLVLGIVAVAVITASAGLEPGDLIGLPGRAFDWWRPAS